MSRIVAPRREWIRSVNNSRLDAAIGLLVAWKSFPVRTLLSRGMTELISTIRMERGHSVEGSFSREFSSTYMVRELSPSEVGSRSRGYQKSGFWGKTTHCGKTLKISFRKDSSRRRTTSCVQISWNLADRKSVKSCIISVTKQKKWARAPAIASARIAPKIRQGQLQTIYLECPKFHPNRLCFRRSYSRTREIRAYQTWHSDRGLRARSCTSQPFGGLRLTHSFAAIGRWRFEGNQTPST